VSPQFDAVVERRDRGYVIRLPVDPKSAFGKVRAPVVVTVNGHAFRTTTMRYGDIDYIGLNREVRDQARLAAGTSASFLVEADTARREVEVPAALALALSGDVAAREAFNGLSYTHRREYARWIAEAKRADTRERRVARAMTMLRAGVKTPD
jgi:Bacteriocin-protection, YdeI or OmpD-Associated/Domain of unknown function (DUF1905)